MCVCVCARICVCLYMCKYANECVYTLKWVYIHIYIYVYTVMCVWICVYTYIYIYIYRYICVNVYRYLLTKFPYWSCIVFTLSSLEAILPPDLPSCLPKRMSYLFCNKARCSISLNANVMLKTIQSLELGVGQHIPWGINRQSQLWKSKFSQSHYSAIHKHLCNYYLCWMGYLNECFST